MIAPTPEIVRWLLEYTFNGDEKGSAVYESERACRRAAETDGGVVVPLVRFDPQWMTVPQPQTRLVRHRQDWCIFLRTAADQIDGRLATNPSDDLEILTNYKTRLARLLYDLQRDEVLSEQQCASQFNCDLVTWRRIRACYDVGDRAAG